jgi:type IV secretion system protein TrbG
MRIRVITAATVAGVALLQGCASHHRPPDVPLDSLVEAQPIPETPRPMQIVEIPQPLPLPGQLKPLAVSDAEPSSKEGKSTNAKSDASANQKLVKQANEAARVEPSKSGFLNAIQVWPYSPGALYEVYTSPGRVTDIALEAGEELRDISAPDTVRWVIGDTSSGAGADEHVHIAVKPTRIGLRSNLVVYTNRRTYFMEMASTPETWMASVSWDYPRDRLLNLKGVNQEREASAPVANGVPVERLQFRYEITGDSPSWRPERAFDDGAKVYIQFPAGIAQTEMPPLFVMGAGGDAQLVNYRVHAPYYIVDRLFGAAELRLGGPHVQTVRIARTDLVPAGRKRGLAR